MRTPGTATLIKTSYIKDQYGVSKPYQERKDVYGYYDSITATELFDGGRNGLNPEFRFTMTDLDYSGESVIERDGMQYSIYRTFKPNNGQIELYAERKGGVNRVSN